HKEQTSCSAQWSARPGAGRPGRPIPGERSSSLDTLADRLGVVDLREKKPRRGGGKGGRPGDGAPSVRASATGRKSPKLAFCFCFSIPLEEVDGPGRPKPRPQPAPLQKPAAASMPSLRQPSRQGRTQSCSRIPTPDASSNSSSSSPGKAFHRPGKSTLSQTARLKHLVPDSLDVATASALMAELAKPHADSDEGGYIYMFWLTPATRTSAPPGEAARSLLLAPSGPTHGRSRRPSEVVSSFAEPSSRPGQKTMLLKIGRATNVQRRMNQWQRQCGYEIEMLRYYPYVAGAAAVAGDGPGTSPTPRTTPHCRKVERLIHIELAGMGLRADMSTCGACGRDHREWFEIQATREGIRKVDGVIRRWVDWDGASVD
ncbi:hypothetical protein E4U41_000260, partial [Claviceps citrina]